MPFILLQNNRFGEISSFFGYITNILVTKNIATKQIQNMIDRLKLNLSTY